MNNILFLIIEGLIKALVIVGIIQLAAAVNVYLERKISAAIQNRIGPSRVGPYGILQPIADVIKLFFKEDVVPKQADKFFHGLAPTISLAIAVIVWAVIPFGHYVNVPLFGETKQVFLGISPDINIGVLFILAMTSVGVYGIALAGWSSNNKYSLLGGLRSAAQMISYELAMGLGVISVVLWTGSLSMNDIVIEQSAWGGWKWNIFIMPVAFIIFLISAFAETNRAPFDLPEAEPELVGGFNTEYSGMKFGMFFLAEYANMTLASAFIVILFLGGWNTPFPPELLGLEPGDLLLGLLQIVTFFLKLGVLIFFFIWVRWSIPRFRYDQLMNLGWKVLLPLGLVNVLVYALLKILL